MAKEPALRYTVPGEVAEALAPYTQTSIAAPPESEMPHLSLAASGGAPKDLSTATTVIKGPSSGPKIVKAAPYCAGDVSAGDAPAGSASAGSAACSAKEPVPCAATGEAGLRQSADTVPAAVARGCQAANRHLACPPG